MHRGLKYPLAAKHSEYFIVIMSHSIWPLGTAYWLVPSTEKLQELLSAVCPNYSSAEIPNGCKVVSVKLRTQNQIHSIQSAVTCGSQL